MQIITAINFKGGIGKTTFTIQIAHIYAKKGKRVLVIDMDSDICATQAFGINEIDKNRTIWHALVHPVEGIRHLVRPYTGTLATPITYSGCIDILPGIQEVNSAPLAFDKNLAKQPVQSFEAVLSYLVTTHASAYDVVLIDPPPGWDRMNDTILFAAQYAIASLSAEALAVRGVANLLNRIKEKNIERATFHISGQTQLLGLLLSKTMPDQVLAARSLLETLNKKAIPAFQTIIPYTTAGWKAPESYLPIDVFAPNDEAAQAYEAVLREMERKIG